MYRKSVFSFRKTSRAEAIYEQLSECSRQRKSELEKFVGHRMMKILAIERDDIEESSMDETVKLQMQILRKFREVFPANKELLYLVSEKDWIILLLSWTNHYDRPRVQVEAIATLVKIANLFSAVEEEESPQYLSRSCQRTIESLGTPLNDHFTQPFTLTSNNLLVHYPEALPTFISLMTSPDREVCEYAMWIVGNIIANEGKNVAGTRVESNTSALSDMNVRDLILSSDTIGSVLRCMERFTNSTSLQKIGISVIATILETKRNLNTNETSRIIEGVDLGRTLYTLWRLFAEYEDIGIYTLASLAFEKLDGVRLIDTPDDIGPRLLKLMILKPSDDIIKAALVLLHLERIGNILRAENLADTISFIYREGNANLNQNSLLNNSNPEIQREARRIFSLVGLESNPLPVNELVGTEDVDQEVASEESWVDLNSTRSRFDDLIGVPDDSSFPMPLVNDQPGDDVGESFDPTRSSPTADENEVLGRETPGDSTLDIGLTDAMDEMVPIFDEMSQPAHVSESFDPVRSSPTPYDDETLDRDTPEDPTLDIGLTDDFIDDIMVPIFDEMSQPADVGENFNTESIPTAPDENEALDRDSPGDSTSDVRSADDMKDFVAASDAKAEPKNQRFVPLKVQAICESLKGLILLPCCIPFIVYYGFDMLKTKNPFTGVKRSGTTAMQERLETAMHFTGGIFNWLRIQSVICCAAMYVKAKSLTTFAIRALNWIRITVKEMGQSTTYLAGMIFKWSRKQSIICLGHMYVMAKSLTTFAIHALNWVRSTFLWRMLPLLFVFTLMNYIPIACQQYHRNQIIQESKQLVQPNFTPLTITFQGRSCTYEKCAHIPIQEGSDWKEIARSKIIKESRIDEHSAALLRFTWRNGSYGKGNHILRIRLVDELKRNKEASSPLFIIAPKSLGTVHECFDVDDDLVKYGLKGSRYVVEVLVESGRYFHLEVNDFEFKTTSSYMREDKCPW